MPALPEKYRARKLEQMFDRFRNWYGRLSSVDQMNFHALTRLPNAQELLARCPDSEYREMGVFVLAVREVSDAFKKNSTAE